MNKCLKNTLITMTFQLFLTASANAVDIQVSCAIPAIPGVNAPLIKEKTKIPPEDYTNTEENQTAFSKTNEPQKAPQE